MKLPRRQFLHLAAGAAALPVLSRIARAQTYPSRPVRWIVGFTPGGGNDIFARLMGQWLQERLGQPFVIENRPGAGSNIATEAVVNARPDGYTILLANFANASQRLALRKSQFQFHPRYCAGRRHRRGCPTSCWCNPSLPVKTIPEFIAYAKANPSKISMASAGIGSTGHVAGELFKMMAGIDFVHVPYRGNAPAITDLLSGQVQMCVRVVAVLDRIRQGRQGARACGHHRDACGHSMPDLPGIAEFVAGL